MHHRAMLTTKIKELKIRLKRLTQLLDALHQQIELETRAEERMRLNSIIAEREADRQQIAVQLRDVEQALDTVSLPEVTNPLPIASPEALSAAPFRRPVEIFYSYSHKDEALCDQLEKHLAILQRQNVIGSWHDRSIQAGTNWEDQINAHLESSDIILLLVSADFIASDYCWGKEVKRAMERHNTGTARVIPIILRAVDWNGAPFSRLQALPKDAKPVTSWPNLDEAFADIARGIRQVATARASTL